MSHTSTVTVELPNDKKLVVACASCNGHRSHKILTRTAVVDSGPTGDETVWDDFYIIQCEGCKTVSFCSESRCVGDYETDPLTGQEVLSVTQKLYPTRIAGRSELPHLYHLPKSVLPIYRESYSALCSSQPILTGAGIRAVVEATCKEQTIPGRNLKERIDALESNALIPKDSSKFLHSLRFMGNNAVHDAKAHTEAELSSAFDVMEHLLRTLYILPNTAGK